MSAYRQRLGKWGEQIAEAYLIALGYEVLARNARTGYGELDLVMRKDGEIVFFEVKTRSNDAFGNPEDAITQLKQEHLINSAQAYLNENNEGNVGWRIDVIAVQGRPDDAAPHIEIFENAVN